MHWSEALRRAGWVCLFSLPAVANSQPEELITRLERHIPEWLSKYDVPGVSVAVIRDSRPVWSQGFGLADVQDGRLMRSGTVMQSATLSQYLTAWGVMKLAGRGQIDLDAPVERYLSRWQLPRSPFDHSKVTIRRLLTHTGGILQQSYPPRLNPEDRPELKILLSGLADEVPPVRVGYRPGSQHLYSDPGYSLLEMVIEDVSGEAFSVFIQQEIFGPLDMRRSNFSWADVPVEQRAAPHDRHGQVLLPYYADQQAAYGLNSTADDMARFVASNLPSLEAAVQGYPVMTRETIQQMQRAQNTMEDAVSSEPGVLYGLGCLVEQTDRGVPVVTQGGFAPPGWYAQVFAVPQTGDGLVILANSANGLALVTMVAKTWSAAVGIGGLRLVRRMQVLQWRIRIGVLITVSLSLILGFFFTRQARRGERRLATGQRPLRIFTLLGLLSACLFFWTIGPKISFPPITDLANWLAVSFSMTSLLIGLLVLFPRKA